MQVRIQWKEPDSRSGAQEHSAVHALPLAGVKMTVGSSQFKSSWVPNPRISTLQELMQI